MKRFKWSGKVEKHYTRISPSVQVSPYATKVTVGKCKTSKKRSNLEEAKSVSGPPVKLVLGVGLVAVTAPVVPYVSGFSFIVSS